MTAFDEVKRITEHMTATEYLQNLIADGKIDEYDLPIGWSKKEQRAKNALKLYIQKQMDLANPELQAWNKRQAWERACEAVMHYNAQIGECGYSDWCAAFDGECEEMRELPDYPLTAEEDELADAWERFLTPCRMCRM